MPKLDVNMKAASCGFERFVLCSIIQDDKIAEKIEVITDVEDTDSIDTTSVHFENDIEGLRSEVFEMARNSKSSSGYSDEQKGCCACVLM